MELLVYKLGDNYLRIKEDSYELTGMNKASVYPLSQKYVVMERFESLKQELPALEIKKLTITESEFA